MATNREELKRLERVAEMPGPSDVLVCDGCGRCWPDDDDSNSESCDYCGRFKQRMQWATIRGQLRRLCYALEIPLTEPKAGGE